MNGSQKYNFPSGEVFETKYESKKAAAVQITKSRKPFKYSPQPLLLLSSRKPVSIISQVKKRIPTWSQSRGANKKQRITNIVMNTTPEPVGLPFAASAVAVKVNALPLSQGR